jgi:hypothetical protein
VPRREGGEVRSRRVGRRLGRRAKAAQDGVDESSGSRPALLARERDAGVHRGVRRHSIELDDLVRAEPEQVLKPGRHLGPLAGHQRCEPGVERALAAEDAGRHLVREPAVRLVEAPERAIERGVERPPGADLGQHVQRGAARGQASRQGHRVLCLHRALFHHGSTEGTEGSVLKKRQAFRDPA